MALSKDDIDAIRSLIGREPSIVEHHIFDTMWSEHCSYKSTKPVLKRLPTSGSEVALGIGEDSGIIRFTKVNGKQYCLAVSHESHNHPSQILPVEGAATGVGGVVRDVYCMGADVIGVLNSLHFGINRSGQDDIVEEIAEKVVLGVADYGNPLGVPVLGGETLYHESYNDNCLVNVAALGLLAEEDIIHSYVPKEAEFEPYDLILFGKSTDATGFGGASFSSATLDKEDESTNIGAVQVHDPFLKRVLVEGIKTLMAIVKEQDVKIGFKDLGAGGISCAASEIAVSGGFGVRIDLDQVNCAISNLAPEIIACSETQERFCLAVPSSFSKTVLDVFNKQYALPKLYPKSGAVVIGQVTKEKQFVMTYRSETVCDLPVESITTEVSANREARPRQIKRVSSGKPVSLKSESLQSLCSMLLNEKNNSSKHEIYSFFDNAVRGNTVVYPGEADAVVVLPIDGCKKAVAVSMDSNLYGESDPFTSGAAAVAESIRNVVAVGGKPIALTDCLNYGNPENPNVFFDFEKGVEGIAEAATHLGFISGEALPIISGNVSLYNESKQGRAIIPSPVLLCVGKIEDVSTVVTMQLQSPGDYLIRVGLPYSEFAGTRVAPYLDVEDEVAPQVRFSDEAKQNQAVHDLITRRKVTACHDISMGGLWLSVVEMVLGERGRVNCGVAIEVKEDPITDLFSENGAYVIAVSSSHLEEVERTLKGHAVDYQVFGKTTQEKSIEVRQAQDVLVKVEETTLIADWSQTRR